MLVAVGRRACSDRVRRGSRRGQDLRRQGGLRHRPEPGAARARRREPRRRAARPGWSSTAACPRPRSTARAGARSQLSGVTVAVLVVVTLLFLTGLFEHLPEATLAAVVIVAVIELVDIPSLVRLYRVWTGRLGGIYGSAARADFIAALAALLGVLVFDTLPGLFIGIGVSLLLLIYRASRPQVATLVRATPSDGDEVAGSTRARTPSWPDGTTSSSCASSRACSSPTPTTCAAADPRTRITASHGRRRPRRRDDTRDRRDGDATCSPPSPASCGDATSSCSWPTASGRSATSCGTRAATTTCCRPSTSTVDDAIASVDRSPRDHGPV